MRKSIYFILCCIPFALSSILAYALSQGWFSNSVIVAQFSMDTAGIVSRIGIFATIVALIGVVIFYWHTNRLASVQEIEQQQYFNQHKQFLKRLDHEIKNPLTTMQIGLINILTRDDLENNERLSLERMQTQVNRLRQLVMDLRSLTELEDHIVERSRVDVNMVIQTTVEIITETSKQEITVTAQSIPWEVGEIVGDIDLLTIVFSNLLNNAVKFTSDDGHIHAKITDDGQHVIVEVADDGIGMPSSEIPHIFDELYRATNAQRIHGNGMGLALVKRIIELHQGHITVHSRENHGTSIKVFLPLANQP